MRKAFETMVMDLIDCVCVCVCNSGSMKPTHSQLVHKHMQSLAGAFKFFASTFYAVQLRRNRSSNRTAVMRMANDEPNSIEMKMIAEWEKSKRFLFLESDHWLYCKNIREKRK